MSASSAVVGAIVGAMVGALFVVATSTVAPSSSYVATATRPAVTAVPVTPQYSAQARTSNVPMAATNSGEHNQEVAMQAGGSSVYGLAFALFAAAGAAVMWNSRRIAMNATTSRREALFAGAAAAGLSAAPAFAAYGDAANVFGKPKDVEQFLTVSGEGWSAQIPSKYNRSKELEVDGQVARWEDNFDAVNNAYVAVRNVGKSSVSDLGDLDSVRNQIITPLLGQQAYEGPSISEGGFAPGRYSSAAVLDQKEETKNGKTYYFYELLTRTADGNEGGRHQLYTLTVSNGKLYIFKTQAGDKRWFKGLERPLRASLSTFQVA